MRNSRTPMPTTTERHIGTSRRHIPAPASHHPCRRHPITPSAQDAPAIPSIVSLPPPHQPDCPRLRTTPHRSRTERRDPQHAHTTRHPSTPLDPLIRHATPISPTRHTSHLAIRPSPPRRTTRPTPRRTERTDAPPIAYPSTDIAPISDTPPHHHHGIETQKKDKPTPATKSRQKRRVPRTAHPTRPNEINETRKRTEGRGEMQAEERKEKRDERRNGGRGEKRNERRRSEARNRTKD